MAIQGTGIGASNQFEAGGFIRSSEKICVAKHSIPLLPVAINYNGTNAVEIHGFQAHVGSMRSPSRGRKTNIYRSSSTSKYLV